MHLNETTWWCCVKIRVILQLSRLIAIRTTRQKSLSMERCNQLPRRVTWTICTWLSPTTWPFRTRISTCSGTSRKTNCHKPSKHNPRSSSLDYKVSPSSGSTTPISSIQFKQVFWININLRKRQHSYQSRPITPLPTTFASFYMAAAKT